MEIFVSLVLKCSIIITSLNANFVRLPFGTGLAVYRRFSCLLPLERQLIVQLVLLDELKDAMTLCRVELCDNSV